MSFTVFPQFHETFDTRRARSADPSLLRGRKGRPLLPLKSCDQMILPFITRAQHQCIQPCATVEQLTVRFPGDTDAAMDLDVLLRGVVQSVGGAASSAGRRQWGLASVCRD